MSIQRLRTEPRLSEIVIHNGTVYLAGQLDENHSEGIEAQTKATLDSIDAFLACLLYTSPSPRDVEESRMPSSA